MVLTEEQKRKIQENRERALALKKKKAEERTVAEEATVAAKSTGHASQGHTTSTINDEGSDEDYVELEDFEVGASQYVTKDEAMRKYCLPLGTLAVCCYVEKPNPRNKSWTPMRLYKRSEIRRRARERFGGLEGLVEERRKRDKKRFANDMAETKDVFKKSKS
jgi:DNA-repair protein complementing XP-A cells